MSKLLNSGQVGMLKSIRPERPMKLEDLLIYHDVQKKKRILSIIDWLKLRNLLNDERTIKFADELYNWLYGKK